MKKLISEVNSILIQKNINDILYTTKKYDIKQDLIKKLNIDYLSILPKPPLNNSRQTLIELEELSKITKELTINEIKLVYLVDRNPMELFEEYLNGIYLKIPIALFNRIYWTYFDIIMTDIKHHYNRPRPEQLAELLNIDINIIVTKTHQTPAYPSGHSVFAYTLAHVCSEYYPEHRKKLFEIADQCGYARMLQGVHYRSDLEAAKELVAKLYRKIRKFDNLEKVNNLQHKYQENNTDEI